MKTISTLKKDLEIKKMNERLEMVIIIPGTDIVISDENNGCCSWTDSGCNPHLESVSEKNHI